MYIKSNNDISNITDAVKEYKRINPIIIEKDKYIEKFTNDTVVDKSYSIIYNHIIKNLTEGKYCGHVSFYYSDMKLPKKYNYVLDFKYIEKEIVHKFKQIGHDVKLKYDYEFGDAGFFYEIKIT